MEQITGIEAIKEYFKDSKKPMTTKELIELKGLSRESREELYKLCAEAIGKELIQTTKQ